MELFTCTLCEDQYPLEFKNDHHKIPKSAGGTDAKSNMEYLCAGCHQTLHAIARMLKNPKKMGLVEDYIKLYFSEDAQQYHCKELAFLIIKFDTFKNEGKLDLSDKKMMLTIELPLLYHTALRTKANECRDPETKRKMGMSKYVLHLIISHLQEKYPKLKTADSFLDLIDQKNTLRYKLTFKKL